MSWQRMAGGTLVKDWLSGNHLAFTDPYLVWLDITDARGSGFSLNGLPMIEDGLGERKFQTNARKRDELRTLLAPPSSKGKNSVAGGATRPRRFEVAAGVVSDDQVNQRQGTEPIVSLVGDDRQQLHSVPRPIVGIIDYGCAFAHRQFMDDSGRTRVLALWNQAGGKPEHAQAPDGRRPLQWRTPPGFWYGLETHRDATWKVSDGALPLGDYIDQYRTPTGDIDEAACYRDSGYDAIQDVSVTHGTHVTDLATGWPSPVRDVPGLQGTVAPRHDADIVFVQLPRFVQGQQVTGLLRANVYDAVRYVLDCAQPGQPVIINLSYGGNAGGHDGTSVLEQALDWRIERMEAALQAPIRLVVPAGNSRGGDMHAVASVAASAPATFAWNILPDDPSDSFAEFWLPKEQIGRVRFRVTSPDGATSAWLRAGVPDRPGDVCVLPTGDAKTSPVAALILPGGSMQSTRSTMALLAVARTRRSADKPCAPYGRWLVEVKVSRGEPLEVNAWCERDDPPFGTLGTPRQPTFSATPTSRIADADTLNSIAHGKRTLVAAGMTAGGRLASYSGLPGDASNKTVVPMPSDESLAVEGLPAAAVYGLHTVRLRGTSQAAAMLTRALLDDVMRQRGPGT